MRDYSRVSRVFWASMLLLMVLGGVFAQEPTPLPLTITTPTPEPSATSLATPIPPTPTPTDQGLPQLVVPADASAALNVRAEPDPESQVLGQISAGQQFVVNGRFFRWIQFQYPQSPTGVGYVFDELVDLIGDQSLIVDLTVATPGPTLDTSALDGTATFEALAQTPGFDLTQTASVRVIEPPSGFSSDPEAEAEGNQVILPTFTYPPNIPVGFPTAGLDAAATPSANRIEIPVSEGIAPIVPMVLLASLGIIGLLLSTLRR